MRAEGGIIERAMREWRIVVTVVAALVAAGVWALCTMPRQEYPEFTIRQGLVVGLMPGASSNEVEEQLAKPVEEYLFGFAEIDKTKTYSVSREGQLVVFVELRESVRGAEAPAFWAKLRHGLDELRAQRLSSRVIALIGDDDFGDTSALLVTVVGKGHSPRELEKHLELLEAKLRRLEATSKLRRVGLQGEVIRVTVDRARLARYAVRPASIWMALQGLGESPAPARLDTDTLELPVHVGRVLRSEKELADVILLARPGGGHVRLGDVATLTREFGHDDEYVRFDGQTAVVLSIAMRHGNDITAYGRQVDAAIAEAARELPPTVEITRVADQPRVVRGSVNHFLRDFAIAIASVIAVTMLLLPARVAAVAAVSIPVTVFMTLGILDGLGVELQTVSLAGLVVVLGMVVDNAIVVIDDHVERLDGGADPWSAAWRSARELAVPITTATLAIVMSYAPFTWFMTGMAGDFVSALPVTVAVALGTSLLVALLVVPALCACLVRRGLGSGRASVLDRLQVVYDRALEAAFRRPALTLGSGAAAVAVGVALAAAAPTQLFPKVDRDQFAVEVTLPAGRPLAETDAVLRRLEGELRADPRVVHVTAFVGTSSPRFHTLYAPAVPARSYGQLLVNTVSERATLELLAEGERRTANGYPDAWVRWKQLDMQNSAAPIEARLSGDDPRALHAAAARVEAAARGLPGVGWVRNDWGEPVQGVSVEPDAEACDRLGVSPSLLQISLAMSSRQGFPAGTIWEGDYPVRVRVADPPGTPETVEAFRQQLVTSPLLAAAVPLEQLARVSPGWSEGAVVRRNGVRTLTVRVDVARGVLASTVQRALEREVKRLGDLPGVRLAWGGEADDADVYFAKLTWALLTAVCAIYLILLVQFRRHGRALLVMLTMPLAIPGSFLGLAIFGFPFGLTAFVGVIGLMGIVVRNGIILVGHADELRAQGLDDRAAALAAGRRRMRPIFLTSAAAAVGVIPLIASGSTLWGPLGAVTFAGLLVSMVLTLVVLPVAYYQAVRRERRGAPSAAAAAAAVALLCLALPAAASAQAADAPLTLARARELARATSAEVRGAEAERDAAVQTRAAAFTAWFPQVSASLAAAQARSPLVDATMPGGNLPVLDPATGQPTGQVAFLPSSRFRLGQRVEDWSITAVQPLFAGGRIVEGSRLAEVGVRAAEEQAAVARRDAALAAEEKYWLLVSLGQRERTLTAYEGLLAALGQQAADAVRAGLATRGDLLAVQLERRKAAVDRLKLESGRRLAARDLRRHLGLPDGEALALADAAPPVPEEPPAPLAPPPDGSRRPELRLLEQAAEAERLKRRLALGEGLPSVAAGGMAGRMYVSGTGANDYALVFLRVSVPITGLWKAVHEEEAAAARQRAARIRLEDGHTLLALDAARCRDALQVAWEGARAADTGVERAEQDVAEKRDQHASGLVTLADLLEAQVKLHQAEDRRIEARVEVALARAASARADGRE
jgi:multidrug efflux pump subunit AcrB/outer membrane protein TolC